MDDDPVMQKAVDKCLDDNDFYDNWGYCECKGRGKNMDCTWVVDECGSRGNPYC